GPCAYTGRPMKPVHTGLGITADDWSVFTSILSGTLEELKVQPTERKEFLDLLERRFKPDVVEIRELAPRTRCRRLRHGVTSRGVGWSARKGRTNARLGMMRRAGSILRPAPAAVRGEVLCFPRPDRRGAGAPAARQSPDRGFGGHSSECGST